MRAREPAYGSLCPEPRPPSLAVQVDVYCSIFGFGILSAYPARPAFDTVIQAMSGLMDPTRSDGEPVRLGASGADIPGGQAALFAIVENLAGCSRQAATFVEISMQDVAAWCALFALGNPAPAGIVVLFQCAIGRSSRHVRLLRARVSQRV
ncbi:CoA transferase [Paraburkholderia phymatum]|uniref:CoA transferase n=1 Tax=Paraburkholderia phymatum TaxID=148447 RepID=UPI00316B08C4